MQKSCSVVLVRDTGVLEATFGHEESYMRRDDSIRNAVERTLEYSRPLRSLKLWLAFRSHGAAAFRGWIEQTLGLAGQLADALAADDADFELLVRPDAVDGVLPAPAGGRADLDAHNAALAAAVQGDGRVYLARGLG